MPSLVSAIIPAYNCGRFVAEAVQSVLDQDYPAKEVIVINDGSADDTLSVLRGFGSAIHLIDQKNGGPPAARNAGLQAVRGDYIAFLDADDVWLPGKLAAQVAYLEANPDVGTVFMAWQVWRPDADGRFRKPVSDAASPDLSIDEIRSGWLYNRLLFDCEILTTTVMLRSSIVRKIGAFDTTMFNGDDYDYWLRASRVAEIHKLKRVGALYRMLSDSISHRPRERNFEYEVIRKAIDRWGLVGPDGTVTNRDAIDQRLEQLVFRHGYAHFHHGDPQLAFSAFRQMLRQHPTNAKLWVYAALAMMKMGALALPMRRLAR